MSRAKSGGLATAAVIIAVYAFAMTKNDNEPGELAIAGAIALVFLAVYWWLAIVRPSAGSEGNGPAMASLVSGILGGVTIAVWWMGLPMVFGGGAVVAGLEGRDRAARGAGRGAMATVGLVLGALAVVVWLIAALGD